MVTGSKEYGREDDQRRSGAYDLMLRLGVAAFLWANIMAFSIILYVGYFEQISPSVSHHFPYILMALATPLVFYCAWPILRSAALGIRNLQLRMETLLALGILTAYILSVAQTIRGQTHVYFDTAAAIVTLVLAGKLIERTAKDRAARSISMLYRLMPRKARVMSTAGERFVSIEALESGSIFVVKAGERIPADGIIVEGETHTDESLLSGESVPRHKAPGDSVVSGSLNAGGVIQVRALRRSEESALSQIIRLVERALSSRAPIERTVDRIARVFVPVVVVIAFIDFAALAATHHGIVQALLRATAILVIACPCALGLATPLAITAAVGSASQSGLLISDSSVLETMGKIDTVVLDKTGTITQGDFRLVEVALAEPTPAHAYSDAPTGVGIASFSCPPQRTSRWESTSSDTHTFENEYLPLLAGIEAYSEHLLARAVVRYAKETNVQSVAVQRIEIHKGQGISAAHERRIVFLGNRNLAVAFGCTLDSGIDERAKEFQQRGNTVSFFGIDSRLCGVLAFGDELKPGAVEMVQGLRRRGISVKLVSGDALRTTECAARQAGITDFTAEATPEDKAEIVRQLQAAGRHVAMLGDGVNDAPALAQADLGIALGTGADIAMSASPVVLVSGALAKVEEAFQLGAKTTQIVRQNLFWAFFYNIAGISLAIAGILTPIFAAAAMLLSSISVVANSIRLSRPVKSRAW